MKAIPAADVVACCSAIPTSKVRFGNSRWNASTPVGPNIAAVNATISFRSLPSSTNASEKTPVHVCAALAIGSPVSASTIPTA